MKQEAIYEDGDTVYLIKEHQEHKKPSFYKIEKCLVTGILIKGKGKILYQLHGYHNAFFEEQELYEDITKCADALIPLLINNINI